MRSILDARAALKDSADVSTLILTRILLAPHLLALHIVIGVKNVN
jgi:hypothetical protein